MKLFFCISCLFLLNFLNGEYYAQFTQDRFVNEHFFHNKRNGTFVDIGASDGIFQSNTYFFEKHLDWTGIAIEPIPEQFEKLSSVRSCCCIMACIGPKEEENVPFLRPC